jgi:hypothetical protein
MNDAKYIEMDVHTATISAPVRASSATLVTEATLETKTETMLEFVVQSHCPVENHGVAATSRHDKG